MEERGNAGSEDEPIVLMLPGVTGSSDENYIQHWIDDVNRLGYRSVVFNYRGCGNSKLSTPRLYSLGDVSDLTEVMEHVHSTHTSSTIVAVGVSMGSIQAINYVAQCKRQGRPCHISAVLVFSTVWNLTISDMALHNHCFNRNVLSRFLAMRFTNIMRQNRTMFEECQNRGELGFNFQTALKSRHLRDLHNSCISHMFGYKADIVRSHSPCEHAHEITVPVIAVNAADDPFSPLHALPVEVAEENGNLVLVTTRTGGHIGFVRWLHPFHKNYMDTILVQFLTAVLRHRCFERDYR
jgi:abhydrolase domain-containing protein 1/3